MKSNEDYILTSENMQRFCSILDNEVMDKDSIFYDERILDVNYTIYDDKYTVSFNLIDEEMYIVMTYNKDWEYTNTWALNTDFLKEWESFVNNKLYNK